MIHFFTTFLSYLLSFYFAASVGISNGVLAMQTPSITPPTTHAVANTTTQNRTDHTPRIIPSQVGGGSIPDILIKNAAYQQASVVDSIPPEKASTTAVDALVNIYCTYRTPDTYSVTTGSGFFIDTNGIILTNAHVAQFLLLADLAGNAHCTVRTGNPATSKYDAQLLYISPEWIRENAAVLKESRPKGTGERDYALLYIQKTLDGSPVPRDFPALPFDTALLHNSLTGNTVYAAGYPAETLLRGNMDAPLVPKLATSTVEELMTFGSNYADIFSISGSDIGERGSSGGPIVDTNGDAIGIISTRGDDALYGKGTLRAITISYIDRTIKEETGYNLLQNIRGDIVHRSKVFRQTMVPFLELVLEQNLSNEHE